MNAAIVLLIGAALIWALPASSTIPLVGRLYAVLVLAALHAVFLLFVVTERAVMQAARGYARQLILSIEWLLPAPSPSSSARSRRPAEAA